MYIIRLPILNMTSFLYLSNSQFTYVCVFIWLLFSFYVSPDPPFWSTSFNTLAWFIVCSFLFFWFPMSAYNDSLLVVRIKNCWSRKSTSAYYPNSFSSQLGRWLVLYSVAELCTDQGGYTRISSVFTFSFFIFFSQRPFPSPPPP